MRPNLTSGVLYTLSGVATYTLSCMARNTIGNEVSTAGMLAGGTQAVVGATHLGAATKNAIGAGHCKRQKKRRCCGSKSNKVKEDGGEDLEMSKSSKKSR